MPLLLQAKRGGDILLQGTAIPADMLDTSLRREQVPKLLITVPAIKGQRSRPYYSKKQYPSFLSYRRDKHYRCPRYHHRHYHPALCPNYCLYSGIPYLYIGNYVREDTSAREKPEAADQQISNSSSTKGAAEPRVKIIREWVPPVMERVKVPGYWAYGARRIWTGTLWKFETDPEKKIWVEESYEWREKQPGYYKEKVIVLK
ncbi:MAG: hypothetical protein JRJ12_14365 [Deltaproteobacteria bacterium]|nr:hypothetical protein [Deltaproteobacteria bacterium]